jgi:hypothetical protein
VVVALSPLVNALKVSTKRPGVGEKPVGDKNGLGVLKVGAAGHNRLADVFTAGDQNSDYFDQDVPDRPHSPLCIHPDKGGNLIVSAPACPNLSANVRANPLNEDPFECSVNVLVRVPGVKSVRHELFFYLTEGGKNNV